MKRFLTHIALFALPVFAFLIWVWGSPVPTAQKWNRIVGNCSKAPCLYELASTNTDSIDVAFLGTSRTMAAVYDTFLSDQWHCRVANLGYCRPGRNVQYEILKLLFAHHQPKTVFIQVSQDEDWYGHFDFGNLAPTSDVLNSIRSKNPKYLRDVERNFVMKHDLFQRQIWQKPYPGSGCASGYWPAGDKKQSISPIQSAPLNSPSQRFTSEYYLGKMIGLCEERGVQIIFHYLPTFGLSGRMPHYVEQYEKHGRVLTDPKLFLREQFWVDTSHLTPEGATKYSECLAQTFSAQMLLE